MEVEAGQPNFPTRREDILHWLPNAKRTNQVSYVIIGNKEATIKLTTAFASYDVPNNYIVNCRTASNTNELLHGTDKPNDDFIIFLIDPLEENIVANIENEFIKHLDVQYVTNSRVIFIQVMSNVNLLRHQRAVDVLIKYLAYKYDCYYDAFNQTEEVSITKLMNSLLHHTIENVLMKEFIFTQGESLYDWASKLSSRRKRCLIRYLPADNSRELMTVLAEQSDASDDESDDGNRDDSDYEGD